MRALVQSMTGDHPARPVLVFSNVTDAPGIAWAREQGIATATADHRAFGKDRAGFEAVLEKCLHAVHPDIICHAGFMRILTPEFARAHAGQMLNIHPSLLPKYPGLHVVQRALEAGDTEAGCTVHEVTADLNAGPILGQARVQVLAGDTAESLAARILVQEHRLYPAVLRRFAVGDRTPVMF